MKIQRVIVRVVHSVEGTGVLAHISETWARTDALASHIPKKGRIPSENFLVQRGCIPSWTYSKADVYRGSTVCILTYSSTSGYECLPLRAVQVTSTKYSDNLPQYSRYKFFGIRATLWNKLNS